MTTSDAALESYIGGIKVYLQQKGVTDFTKFEVSLHKDKLRYMKWDYSTIEKPTLEQMLLLSPPPDKVKTTTTLYYILEIGSEEKTSYKSHMYNIPLPFVVEDINQISMQITIYQSAIGQNLYDDLYSNIRAFYLQNNGRQLDVEVNTFRRGTNGWSHSHRAFLTITIVPKGLTLIPLSQVYFTHKA
jgi:hypothetical protein